MTRLVAVHFCPAYDIAAPAIVAAAESRSASASTMAGFWPPISAWTGMPRRAARSTMPRPVATDPVKETACTARAASNSPTLEPESGAMLRSLGQVRRRQFNQTKRGTERRRCRLDDDPVAHGERGSALPQRDRHREVPRADRSDHADRMTLDDQLPIPAWRGIDRGLGIERRLGVVTKDRHSPRDLAAGLRDGFADFARGQFRERGGVCLDRCRPAAESTTACGGVAGPAALRGCASRDERPYLRAPSRGS